MLDKRMKKGNVGNMREVPWEIKISLAVLLLICSYGDIKRREISLFPMLIVSAFIMFFSFISHTQGMGWIDRLYGAGIGVLLIVISLITKGQIGMGDGFLFIVIGFGVGFWNSFSVLIYSLIFVCIGACCLLGFKKKQKKTEVPFVPFIGLGYISLVIAANI